MAERIDERARHGRGRTRWRGPTLLAAACCVLACGIAIAPPAAATPDVVPFNGPGDYGFTSDVLESIDPQDVKEFDEWRTAADASLADPTVLLLAHRISIERCTSAGLGCAGEGSFFEVVWDIELNEGYELDGAPIGPSDEMIDVNLFLATWDRNPLFTDNPVAIVYDSLAIDGVALDFEVAQYVSQSSGTRYSFLNIGLPGMVAGADGIREVSFRYEVVGDLPLDGAGTSLHAPYVGIGGFFANSIETPEPSTGLLLGLSLMAAGLRRRGA